MLSIHFIIYEKHSIQSLLLITINTFKALLCHQCVHLSQNHYTTECSIQKYSLEYLLALYLSSFYKINFFLLLNKNHQISLQSHGILYAFYSQSLLSNMKYIHTYSIIFQSYNQSKVSELKLS